MFKAKEVGQVLGFSNISKYLTKMNPDWKMGVTIGDPHGRPQLYTMINEKAVYRLAFRSDKKIAVEFTETVCDILKTIRLTGKYEHEYKTPKPMLAYKLENETDLHKKTINFIRQHQEGKHLLFTSTLGEMQDDSSKRIDAWQKGYTKGMPDLILFNPTNKYIGLVVEFKTPKCTGSLSEEQQQIIKHFKSLKYKVIVSNDYDVIIIKLHDYINQIRVPCQLCDMKFRNGDTLTNHKRYFHRVSSV